ncbi:MAG: hypothetical protein IH608_06140, partial [Proteobacteria bacterium]|nr:hypothetical protein [Pseudomonadota bacterium]
RDTIRVAWSAATGAESYRVELVGVSSKLTTTVTGSTNAVFAGVPDNANFTANVYTVNAGGETKGSTATVKTNHFPWDEYYATSLHLTRAGKETWYSAKNGGLEKQMKLPMSAMYQGCQGCHRADQPIGTNGCEGCHDTPTPKLGAKVDATLEGVCGGCHNRSVYEAVDHKFTDVHRDELGFDCMSCHTMGDVHGDGVAHGSMFEEGAIDAKCENCHETRENNLFHSTHEGTVACTLCHMQMVLSCYNCHVAGALLTPPEKVARRRILDWKFMVNYKGKVAPANVFTAVYGQETFAAIAPYTTHTIARNAVKGCGDCHKSAIMADLDADGVLKLATYDPATTNVKNLKGFIPVPYNYEDAFKFDFLSYDRATKKWSLLEENGPDRFQMLYAQPLTREQMNKLR